MEGRLEGDSLEKGPDKHSVAHQTLSWLPVISEISVEEVGGLLVVTHTGVEIWQGGDTPSPCRSRFVRNSRQALLTPPVVAFQDRASCLICKCSRPRGRN